MATHNRAQAPSLSGPPAPDAGQDRGCGSRVGGTGIGWPLGGPLPVRWSHTRVLLLRRDNRIRRRAVSRPVLPGRVSRPQKARGFSPLSIRGWPILASPRWARSVGKTEVNDSERIPAFLDAPHPPCWHTPGGRRAGSQVHNTDLDRLLHAGRSNLDRTLADV